MGDQKKSLFNLKLKETDNCFEFMVTGKGIGIKVVGNLDVEVGCPMVRITDTTEFPGTVEERFIYRGWGGTVAKPVVKRELKKRSR